MEGFGATLKRLRGNKSQLEVAMAIGVVPSAIANYEAEVRIPRDEVKIKLAEYYNTTVEKIFYAKSSRTANFGG